MKIYRPLLALIVAAAWQAEASLNPCASEPCGEIENSSCAIDHTDNTGNTYECVCDDGYAEVAWDGGDGFTCEEWDDPCDENPCGVGVSTCVVDATGLTYECVCDDGYADNGPFGACVDVDECAKNSDDCDVDNAICYNTKGGHMCVCKEGWYGDGVTCEWDDPCDENPCGVGVDECSSTEGESGFICTCKEGFIALFMDSDPCSDFDECATGEHNCDANASCTNTEGGFECACLDGYSGDGSDGNCVADVVENPCASGVNPCGLRAKCMNYNGEAVCHCPTDWRGDPMVRCDPPRN